MSTVETLAFSLPLIKRVLSRLRTGWLERITGSILTREQASIADWAIGLLRIEPGDRVLDAGCGSGNAIRMMLKQGKAGFVAGIDYSTAMVDQSRNRNSAAVDSGRCQIRQTDITSLPFPDSSFDKITTIETLYFWPDPLAGLIELRRVLAPGGKVAVVLEYTRDGNDTQQMDILQRDSGLKIYHNEQVAASLRGAGFDSVRIEYRADRKWLYVEGTVIAE